MKKARPWLYFLLSIFVIAALSTLSKTAPELYDGYAWTFSALLLGATLVLSVVALRRWRKHENDPTDPGGFGLAALPLPRSWKRWIYDEPTEKKRSK